jgi:hypothetical protein
MKVLPVRDVKEELEILVVSIQRSGVAPDELEVLLPATSVDNR